MTPAPYTLTEPSTQTTPVVFSSPHSGRHYPDAFLNASLLDARAIRSSEDAFVEELWSCAPLHGAPLIAATMPRAFIDLNRNCDELDPAVIEGVRHVAHNPRISSGLGVIPRVVAGGRAIVSGKMPRSAAEERIELWWRPYHARLGQLVEGTIARFGTALVIDCHSMPREAVENHFSAAGRRPDVVLGDRFGSSADGRLVEMVESLLAAEGLRVLRNMPFAGAYITQTYGNPTRNRHVIQIEVDRGLYMNERTLRKSDDYPAFQMLIDRVAAGIAAGASDFAGGERRHAAE